jgi:hypothetical protein
MLEQVVASLFPSLALYEGDNKLFQTCRNNWEQALRTHPETWLENKPCYNLFADL